jgi:hypothetical protein
LLHAAQIGLAAAGRRALHGNLRWGLILVLSGCGKMPNWNEVPEENPSGAEAPSLLLRRLRHDCSRALLQSILVAICLTQVAPNILRARPLVKPHILCLPE